MPSIAVLPPHVSNLIAAGEVVERPASVVKELLENAIDAGATVVTVEIKRGGKSFIRVTDNGCGMDGENAARAFLRHATSKISHASDLAGIRTLGFRGEALAAIASVSRIDLLTRQTGQEMGLTLTLEAGRIADTIPSGCPEGTTIVVRDLFYNTPARQKFLKKDATEASHIQETVLRAALGHPEISIRFVKDGVRALHTPGDGVLENVIYTLFGRDFAHGLLPVDRTEGDLRVHGFTGRPCSARASRAQQYFLTLGRPVRSRTLTAALEEGYKGSLMQGRAPVCVLHLELPPETFDINVHPAKAEIKFMADRQIYDMVYHAVKTALLEAEPGKEITLKPSPAITLAAPSSGEKTPGPAGPPSLPKRAETEAVQITVANTGHQTGQYAGTTVYTAISNRLMENAELKMENGGERENGGGRGRTNPAPATCTLFAKRPQLHTPHSTLQEWRFIGEALGGYLLAESPDCLWIIDKHAAHERLIYNRLKEQASDPMSQQLMAPQMVTLSAPECETLLSERDFLEKTGFVYDSMGPGTLAVRAAPGDIETESIPALLSEVAGLLGAGRRPELRDRALHIIACKAAVKLGRSSAPQDMKNLCKLVMETDDLRHCPHGRPVTVRITRSELGRQFGR